MIQAAIIIEMMNGSTIRYVRDALTAKTGDDGATPPTQKYAGEPGRYYAYTGNGNDKYSDQTGSNGKIVPDLASLETSFADNSTPYLSFPDSTPTTTLIRYNEDQKNGKRTFIRQKIVKEKIARIYVEEIWTPGINHTDWGKLLPTWSPNFRADGWNEGKLGPYQFPAETAKTLSKPNILSKTSTTTSVTITWSPDPDYTSYDVYVFDKKVATGITASTYAFTGLKSGVNYTVGVCGVIDDKSGPINFVDKPTVMATTTITATENTNSIALSWTAVNGADFYRIYIDGIMVENFYKSLSYKITGLLQDTERAIDVVAVNALSNNISTTSTTATTEMATPILTVSDITDTTLTLSWTATATGYTYNVYQDGVLLEEETSLLTLDVTGLDPETEYVFGVSAVNGSGEESDIITETITTLAT